MLSPEEVRIMGLSAPVMLKMLSAREERILNKIFGEFQNGKLEHTASLAEFVSVRSQINEINNVLNQHNKVEGKKHAATATRES